jgi:1,4-alpha-glucan branching enzyme
MSYELDHFINTENAVWNYSLLNSNQILTFQTGELFDAYRYFGAHENEVIGCEGYVFTVWAPNAAFVSVVGEFNDWDQNAHPLFPRLDQSGIWEGFIPGIEKGICYRFFIQSVNGTEHYKSDPYSFFCEKRPASASITIKNDYQWKDDKWMNSRVKNNALTSPWNVYEMHIGSWMRPHSIEEGNFHSYIKLAELLIPYLKNMGFTHVEFMPVMEHPLDESWGYQCTGYFAPTSRFGTPEDFKFLIDQLHQHEIGVILDWVPSHFPGDAHGLYFFDGAHTYEYADRRRGFHPDWNSYVFNYGRGEVRSFLISSAYFWLKEFHADGIRVDAVNSMLRLDYSRTHGQWEPNLNGNNVHLEAEVFLRKLNSVVYRKFNDVQTIAEEASDWPMITHRIEDGGLGFGMKWMMGWMHDSFLFFKTSPSQRYQLKDVISFSMMYFHHEKFMLPLSHDEVVHGKSSMIYKMPGDEWQQFANLRLLYVYMYTHPGAKLMFMGNEFGQTAEWNENAELDWHLLQYDCHQKLSNCVRQLSNLYKSEKALYEQQFSYSGFEWMDLSNRERGILVFRRKSQNPTDDIWVVLNFSAVNFSNWELAIEGKKVIKEIFNSNAMEFWGSGNYMNQRIETVYFDKKNKTGKIKINIPALSAILLK